MTPINEIPAVCNYGTSAVYSDYPNDEQLRKGVIPLDSLPAAWWNKMWCASNCAINEARDMVGQLITEINSVLAQAGVCPAAVCTDQLYQSINLIRQRLATASVAGSVISSNEASKVAVANDGTMSVNCLGNAASLTTSASTIVGAINELKSTYDCCFSDTATAIGGKAPTSHASSATTYGVGNANNYGHLKISDTYTSVLAACSGVAASQKALACVYAVAAAAAEGNVALGNTAGCALGTASAGTAITAARSDHVHPKPSRTDLGLGTAAAVNTISASAVGDIGWSTEANRTCVPNISKLAYWNGAFQGTSSNLRYYCGGAFGTAAKCDATAFRASTWTPSLVSCARAVWNRPGSTEASKVCNAMFYAGCSNASCVATNYAACICGSNGWMYGLAGIVLPYIRAVDPGSAASKVCNVQISAYCNNAQGTKTTRTWTFCGSDGYMRGNVCGNVCGDVYGTATNSCKVYKTMATDDADRQVLLGEASEGSGCGYVYVGNACKLTFNPSTGVLCTTSMNAANYMRARLMIMCCIHLRDSSGRNAMSLFDPHRDLCDQHVSVSTYCEHFDAGVNIVHFKAAATCSAQRCVFAKCLINTVLCHTNKTQLITGAICTQGCSMWTTLDQATRCGSYIYFINCGSYCGVQVNSNVCFTTSDTCQLRCGGINNLVVDMTIPL